MYKPFYNLRVRFAQCEMSQNEVARAAGMASSTMTARMTGAQPFDAWQIEKIAKTLNIPRRNTANTSSTTKRRRSDGTPKNV